MKQLITRNRYFIIPYIVFLIFSGLALILFSKTQIHIELNKLHSPFFDEFFKRITYLGDGLVYVLLLVILLFYSYRWTLVYVSAVVISNLMVIIGKQLIFQEAYRPSKYFEIYESYKLYLVDGVNLHSLHSFPSGHTTTAFTIFLMLAFLVRNKALKFGCFVVAILTGYSRIYLSQHFLVDVVVGSAIGAISIFMMWQLFEGFQQSWLDESLRSKFVRRSKKDIPVLVSE